MPGGVGLDELMANAESIQGLFKKRLSVRRLGVEAVGKLRTVVGLDALDGIEEALDTVADKFRRRVCTMLFECLQIAETAVFVQKGVRVIVTPGVGSADRKLDSLCKKAQLMSISKRA